MILIGGPSTVQAAGLEAEGSAMREDSHLSKKLLSLTRGAAWKLVDQIKVQFKTFHCQGMVKIGNDFWISSVEVEIPTNGAWDRSKGKGHLFRISGKGELLADVAIGEGAIYHPSGIDFDGSHIYIAAAEYRPDSNAIIYRFDPTTQKLQELFRWQDHIGGVLRDPETNTLHGISWGSRRFYRWALDKAGNVAQPLNDSRNTGQPLPIPKDLAKPNPSFYIDYQDGQYIGGGLAVYTGLNAYKKPDGSRFALGGIEVVDLEKLHPVRQVPVEMWSPVTGGVITQNPSYFEVSEDKLRAYFMPDDNESTIFVYEL